MSLTVISFSLIGAFGGAVAGLLAAYPRNPGKFVLGGAFAGALLVGGGSVAVQDDDLMQSAKCTFVACDKKDGSPQP